MGYSDVLLSQDYEIPSTIFFQILGKRLKTAL